MHVYIADHEKRKAEKAAKAAAAGTSGRGRRGRRGRGGRVGGTTTTVTTAADPGTSGVGTFNSPYLHTFRHTNQMQCVSYTLCTVHCMLLRFGAVLVTGLEKMHTHVN